MTTLTPAQIAVVASGAGFAGDGLRWAVAIALAESGGRTDAVGVNSDQWHSRDRGLWQINDHWNPDVTDAQAFDPPTCAGVAYRLSRGGTYWKPWSSYNSGAAGTQLGRATAGVNSMSTAAPVDFHLDPFGLGQGLGGLLAQGAQGGGGLASLAASLAAMGSLAIHAGQWLANPSNWLRIALVIAGGGAALAGIYLLANSGIGGPVGAAAGAGKKTAHAAGQTVKKTAKTAASAAVLA